MMIPISSGMAIELYQALICEFLQENILSQCTITPLMKNIVTLSLDNRIERKDFYKKSYYYKKKMKN